MASVEELLLKSLKDLGEKELKEFQWHLKKNKGISNSELENVDRLGTVDTMVDNFGEEAVKITVEILKKMNKNNLAKQLDNNHKQDVSTASPPNGTSSTNLPATDVSTPSPPIGTSSTNFPDPYQFTLDPNTAYEHLHLSESNKEVSYTNEIQSYPDHPERFDYYHQVLCNEKIRERCYWKTEWSGNCVYISVSYKTIGRKGNGDECVFGQNNKSWSLICYPDKYIFMHNNIMTSLSVKPISRTIGVFVDKSAEKLSFYSISEMKSLIHEVQTKFTEPLYPGFYLDYKSSVKLC